MHTLKLALRLLSPQTGPLKGDSLFGHLCWSIRNQESESRLNECLQGYTEGHPFAVISDALPAGHLPRPALPLSRFAPVPGADRKRLKKSAWVPLSAVEKPVTAWLSDALPMPYYMTETTQPHNTINRMTGTTGTGMFAPYQSALFWVDKEARFDLYITHDDRISADSILHHIQDIGAMGHARDASIGHGRFEIIEHSRALFPAHPNADALLTLAPSAPQGLPLDQQRCWYQPFTRFGRHGDLAVHSGRPFKNPILLADTGALLTPLTPDRSNTFLGQGLGGRGSLSRAIEETVHQGYAPVVAVKLEDTP